MAEYVKINNITAKQFKDGKPGDKWLKNFMKRNKLSMKKAEMISASRKANTANPFIIYDFFEQLEKIFEEHPELDETKIYNCDESGFPTDQTRGNVIGPVGQRGLKLSYGARRENITVLGVCSASGKAFDPLIIFKGKNLMSSWFGENALPNTYYGNSNNGWMDSNAFAKWFDVFVDTVKERPLLLLFDGHLTHVTIPVITRALEENIIIIKFPPHCTDVLQPLDKTCFGPLKQKWQAKLGERMNTFGSKSSLTKSEFINLLCSIWNDGMTEANIKSGFSSTGIWPLNKEKYPVNRFDPRLLRKYKEWKEAGGKELNWDELANNNVDEALLIDMNENMNNVMNNEASIPTCSKNVVNTFSESDISMVVQPCETSSPMPHKKDTDNEILLKHLGPVPYNPPKGYNWVPNGWKLEKVVSETTKSFDEIFLDKVKGPQKKKSESAIQIDLRGKIISQETFLAEIQNRKKNKKKESKSKSKKSGTKVSDPNDKQKYFNKKSKQKELSSSSESEVEEVDLESENESSNDYENASSNDSEDENDNLLDCEMSDENIQNILWKTWDNIFPPVEEEDIKGKWFAIIYMGQKVPHVFIARFQRRFRFDCDAPVEAIECVCLKEKLGFSNTELEEQANPKSEIIVLSDVMFGPLDCTMVGRRKWKVPNYFKIKKFIEAASKYDRIACKNRYICNKYKDE